MLHRILSVLAAAAMISAVPLAALATPVAIRVPEPSTLSVLMVGLTGTAGFLAFGKWIRRK
jgi:hypothetical protein